MKIILNIPDFNILCVELVKFLKGFKPTTMHHLDGHGNWAEHPKTVRDRVSNELWYRIWEAEQKGDRIAQIEKIIRPFIADENTWEVTRTVFNGIKKRNSEENDLLIIFEVLYWFIEHEANRRNCETFVADWDHKGKLNQKQYLKKTQEFMNRINQLLSSDTRMKILFRILDSLREEKDIGVNGVRLLEGLFNRVSIIIAEEEKVRQGIKSMLMELKERKGKDDVYATISEQLGPALGMMTRVPEALLRPCLDLLTNKEVPISSGLQFEASSILGALKDLRCSDGLFDVLDNCDAKHINLRCNLIYTIGNLKQQKSLLHLLNILQKPDSIDVYISNGTLGYKQSLNWEKCEAMWAIGKLCPGAIETLPTLMRYANSGDNDIKRVLAWTMSMIGKTQKQKYGGIDAGIVTTLMALLTTDDSKTFEESAYGLRRLELPDFLHSLYLHSMKAIPILSLKPSNAGLYELSETLFHLVSVKKPVVMAVTGDSGTGKTYFCEAIVNGFGNIRKDEILYLMRDNSGDMYLFYRMLGIKLLKEILDPELYQDYPLSESEDDPDVFFNDFILKCANKKLIILDGWMDESYFYQIIKLFYLKGYLDTIVNFRTTFSTKRLNLEEREGLLENVKTCLSYVEQPVIEETEFYRNGDVLVYNLDNSSQSRLCKHEILDVFARQKVETWGDYIRVGNFEKNNTPLTVNEEYLSSSWEECFWDSDFFTYKNISYFSPREAHFSRILNEDIKKKPNLLQIVKITNAKVNRIAFYTQGQIAFCGYDGTVGILSGLNDQVFYTDVHSKKAMGLCIVGGDICSFDVEGSLKITSFGKNTITNIASTDSPVSSITSDRSGRIVTGHMNGAVKIWDIQSKETKIVKGHTGPVLAVTVDRSGRICSGGRDKEVRLWDIAKNRVKIFKGHESPITVVGFYPDGRIVTGTGFCDKGRQVSSCKLRMINLETAVCNILHPFDYESVDAMNIYFDGRIIVGLSVSNDRDSMSKPMILDPRSDFCQYKILSGHGLKISDCVTVGPRIITCGTETDAEHTLRIWGTEYYVKIEHDKLKLMSDTRVKPSYYRTLF